MQMSIDVHAVGGGQTVTQRFRSTLVLDNTLLLDPMNVTIAKGKVPSSAMRRPVVDVLALGLVFGVLGLLV